MKTIKKVFKNKELLKRILITLGFLFIFRLGAALTIPGITVNSITMVESTTKLLEIINTLGGGSLEQFSIFAMGVSPYITSSIVIELLSMEVIPVLARWKKEGEKGKVKISKVTAVTSAVLAFVQAISIVYMFDKSYGIVEVKTVPSYLYIASLMTAGTMMAMWIGNQITKKGVGNGVSLLIFTGIVSNLPTSFWSTAKHIITLKEWQTFVWFGLFALAYLSIIFFVVFVENSVRKIPITYASNSHTILAQDKTYLPFKINISGVIPVIFASSIMVAPQMIGNFFLDHNSEVLAIINKVCDYTQPIGFIIYISLIVAFAFFYSHLQTDVKKITDNFKKNGGNIPGVRTGEETKKYLTQTINRITVFGSLALIIIAVTPILAPVIWEEAGHLSITLGGTSLIIMCSVALESCNQLSQSLKRKDYTKEYSLFTRGGR